MRRTLAAAASLVIATSLIVMAQTAPAQKPASPPAPKRDMNGVWFKRNPPGMNLGFTGSTFTDPKTSPPPLSAWGLEKRKANRANNNGDFTLDQTNDPVLIKCYPPGTPRVYFHPYPFELIATSNSMIQ